MKNQSIEKQIENFLSKKYDLSFENLAKKKNGNFYEIGGCNISFNKKKDVFYCLIKQITNFYFCGNGKGKTIQSAFSGALRNYKKDVNKYLSNLKYEIYDDADIFKNE